MAPRAKAWDYTTGVETRECDVLIIGAGPAGSVTARILAAAGLRCLIVEQTRFPREKVCGECLSALGVDVLRRVGLLDLLLRAGARRLDHAILHAMHFPPARLVLPRSMLGVSRGMMDQMLLDGARSAGAESLQPARCERIESSGAIVRCLATNRLLRVKARQIVLADGKGAVGLQRPPTSGDLGIKAHLTDVDAPPGAIELFGGRGFYGGLAGIEGARWNIAIAVPQTLFRACGGSAARVFERLRNDCPTLRDQTRHATLQGCWHASPLPRFPVRRDRSTTLLPTGNALSAIEPIGGEGMGLAMRSAECIAHAIRKSATLPIDRTLLQSQLQSIWGARGRACRAAAWVITRPGAARIALHVARAAPALAAQWARLAGK